MNEDTAANGKEERWFIDLNWYQDNKRSFSTLAQRCLCSKCRKKLKVDEGEVTAARLMAAIKDCCSEQPGFITGELPVMESIFRILLAGGNQPVDTVEIGESLRSRRGGSPGGTAKPIVLRLLTNDRYYGISPYRDE